MLIDKYIREKQTADAQQGGRHQCVLGHGTRPSEPSDLLRFGRQGNAVETSDRLRMNRRTEELATRQNRNEQ